MIFVTVGSQKFQFDRLLMKLDELVEKGQIEDEVFAQIGYSNYIPKHYKYEKFVNRDKFCDVINNSWLVITHAGTGAIVNSLKRNKKVIAVARLSKFNEHVDDHQLDILGAFNDRNYIIGISDENMLVDSISKAKKVSFNEFVSTTDNVINDIDKFIENNT